MPMVLVLLPAVDVPTASASLAMHVAVPAYFYPGSNPDPTWSRLGKGAPIADLAVLNPASGPGTSPDSNYSRQVVEAQRSGLAVIGYVDTAYATRPLTDVKAEVDRHYQWYGVDGIFFDQATTAPSYQPYFVELFNDVKARTGKRTVAINPGTATDESYMAAADIVLTFEGAYADYRARVAPAWEARYSAERFWHVVYDASKVEMRRAVDLAHTRNVGHVYVTGDDLPNPWDTLPSGPYWSDELARIVG